jgi:carboxymethylenebutenolidase
MITSVCLLAMTVAALAYEDEPPPAINPEEPPEENLEPDRFGGGPGGGAEAWEELGSEEAFQARHAEVSADGFLHGRMIRLGDSHAYLSLPRRSLHAPGMVLIHDRDGLDTDIKIWADRLAAEGDAAIAVDLFDGASTRDGASGPGSVEVVDAERALALLDSAVTFLADDASILAPRVGCIGWGDGGGWALRLAAHNPAVRVVVSYYSETLLAGPIAAVDDAPALCAIVAADDPATPSIMVRRFERELAAAGVAHVVQSYDAPRGFANPSSAVYHELAAEDAWDHVRGFLAIHLRARH